MKITIISCLKSLFLAGAIVVFLASCVGKRERNANLAEIEDSIAKVRAEERAKADSIRMAKRDSIRMAKADSIYMAYKDSLTRRYVGAFKERLRNRDVKFLKNHAEYPLSIGDYYTIKDASEFERVFGEVFDDELTQKILETDNILFDPMMLYWTFYAVNDNSALLLRLDGQDSIVDIYSESEYVKRENAKMQEKDTLSICPSVRKFVKSRTRFETPGYFGRVDLMSDSPVGRYIDEDVRYRLTLWKKGHSMLSEPDVCLKGFCYPDGSCGNSSYIFPDTNSKSSNAFVVLLLHCEYDGASTKLLYTDFSMDGHFPVTNSDLWAEDATSALPLLKRR